MFSNTVHKVTFSLISHSLNRRTRKIAWLEEDSPFSERLPQVSLGGYVQKTLSQQADSDQEKKRQTPLAFGLYTKNHHISDLGNDI